MTQENLELVDKVNAKRRYPTWPVNLGRWDLDFPDIRGTFSAVLGAVNGENVVFWFENKVLGSGSCHPRVLTREQIGSVYVKTHRTGMGKLVEWCKTHLPYQYYQA